MLRNCLCQKIYTVEEVYLLFVLKKEYPPKPLDFKLHKQAEITWVSFQGVANSWFYVGCHTTCQVSATH